jgi:hypothetical protein
VFWAALAGVAANPQTQLKRGGGIVVSTTETEKQKTNQGDPGGAAEEKQQEGGSGARKALKIGGLAAAAGTAAFAASKAMGTRAKKDEYSESSEDGAEGGRGGRVSTEQIVSAIGNARWDVLRDIVVPIAENGARSAGAYVAKEGPEFLSESLVPKFIEGFTEGQGQRSESGRN